MDIIKLSEHLLFQVRMQEPAAPLVEQLETIPFGTLRLALDTDERKKAFWINIYNAFFQLLRSEKKIPKPEIYRKKSVVIAGTAFSLDDIEHGILRRYRLKWALGYLPDLLASRTVKRLAVSRLDYRIHFALNCGARSCPPIAFYTADKIDQQLERAALSFLEAETTVYSEQNEVHISRLLQWYIGDFGGKNGIRRILYDKLHLDTKGHRIVFNEYDWTEQLDNFSVMSNQ
ncbi:MAG: DUF547 domain-containing protein [Haliscomenobacteraceae bacterium CHB4]|nr:DUF547 domain-containing protein [Haliscomenobacteraceae bacterium CHB4]